MSYDSGWSRSDHFEHAREQAAAGQSWNRQRQASSVSGRGGSELGADARRTQSTDYRNARSKQKSIGHEAAKHYAKSRER